MWCSSHFSSIGMVWDSTGRGEWGVGLLAQHDDALCAASCFSLAGFYEEFSDPATSVSLGALGLSFDGGSSVADRSIFAEFDR